MFSFYLASPEILVLVTAVTVLLADIILGRQKSAVLSYGAYGGLLAALILTLSTLGFKGTAFGVFEVDNLTIFARILIITGVLLVTMTAESSSVVRENRGEFLSLILFASVGAMALSGARDLILFYVGLELLTIPSFVLAGLNKKDSKGGEGAIKYFILGVLASAFLIYGISIIYGLTGQTDFMLIAQSLTTAKPYLLVGTIMFVGAVSFKITAVPFHFWAPDAYEGAIAPVAAFIATVSKAGAFAGIIRIFSLSLAVTQPNWLLWFGAIAVLTMTVGNLTALAQTNIKRMLAYSGVAHAGYMLIGLAVGTQASLNSTLFYLATYAAATSGAFFVISAVSAKRDAPLISDYAGLSKSSPLLAFLMAVFMLSLVGLPPFAGFIGKVYLFGQAIESGFLWLALAGVINSVISFGYYSKVLKAMYLEEPAGKEKQKILATNAIPLAVSASAIVLLVVLQTPVLDLLKGIGF